MLLQTKADESAHQGPPESKGSRNGQLKRTRAWHRRINEGAAT
jgi:hypothetical protein